MKRLAVALLALALLAPLLAEAQPSSRVPRVGYLEGGVASAGTPFLEAFRQGLRDLGWIEGQNIALEIRSAEGKYERLPELVAELVRLKVDVIVASSTPASLAAKQATTTVPIVIGRVADPVGSGLVATLARPGGNMWTHQGRELRAKYLDLLKEAIPGATRVGVLWNPANPIHKPSLASIEAAAQALKVELHLMAVQDPKEIESTFAVLTQKRVEALTVFPDGMFLAQAQQIITLAARNRIPAMYGITEFAKAGGLMGYGVNLPDMYRRGASFVDRILKGARPADLPVEQPTTFELVINRASSEG
jgi:ABC-type uncharacterized transport system substrate-binding protein